MSAKEMLENMGYRLIDNEFYLEFLKKEEKKYLIFWKSDLKKVTIGCQNGFTSLDVNELQAINKQIVELK